MISNETPHCMVSIEKPHSSISSERLHCVISSEKPYSSTSSEKQHSSISSVKPHPQDSDQKAHIFFHVSRLTSSFTSEGSPLHGLDLGLHGPLKEKPLAGTGSLGLGLGTLLDDIPNLGHRGHDLSVRGSGCQCMSVRVKKPLHDPAEVVKKRKKTIR